MSAARSKCWADERRLPVICPARDLCTVIAADRDSLLAINQTQRIELARLRGIIDGMAERAERTPADDLRDGDGEG